MYSKQLSMEELPMAKKIIACPTCGKKAERNPTYDAYFCDMCDIWIEKSCGDPHCEFCSCRPNRPSLCRDK
jgi:hypothetical protein